MTNMKDKTAAKLQKAKADNAVVYKVMVALLLLCASLLGLRHLHAYYGTIGGFDALEPLTIPTAIIGAVVFVAAALVLILVKNRIVRLVFPWILPISAMITITALNMHTSWTENFSILYYLACAILLQYIIYQLYRWEFFLFSLSTASAGGLFLSFSNGLNWTVQNILILAAALIILLLTTLFTKIAVGNAGMLVFGRTRMQLFPAKANPLLIYLANGLWLVCIIAALFLGSLFSYYCMFAALAVEFIAAVYYTFQLN